ncbi:MAG: hypothetical protein GXY83_31430 [Rhodopirellula sp.]|nr:hypothetical protein [Rhodopirellula sp.]
MLAEQFIQDAICRPDRIERVVRQMGKADWTFGKDDIVNQEFNFSAEGQGGRIDVLATFNGLTSLLIVEVKAGIVGDADVEQLDWYLTNWRSLTQADPRLANVGDVTGAVLAEGFLPISRNWQNKNISFVEFKLAAEKWPFSVVTSSVIGEAHPVQEGTVFKHSRLTTLKEHREYLATEELQAAFDRIAACFLQKDDERLDWVLCNPKGQHVAIHYKGHYIIWVFVQKHSFDVGYGKAGGPSLSRRVTRESPVLPPEMEAKVLEIVAEIDGDMGCDIPPGFNWRSLGPAV